VILSPKESGGKMIGLEGDWGAGKTTVISLLKKRLSNNDAITVFCYDAWAHEGDPLRRTFLESLIQHLQDITWIDLSESQKTLEEIANRRSETKTRTIPQATKFGRNLAISLFLVPVGGPFLSEALRRGLTLDPTLPITSVSLSFILGLIFTSAPFMMLLREAHRILWPRWKTRKDRVPHWYKARENTDEVYAWSFLQGNAITDTTQLTIKTPDPTSIEFENYFYKWMNEAIGKHPVRKAIMVLDNLDRVDPKDAQSIWSTLQTFLQCRNDRRTEEWFKKLWIIIPYDPHGLKQLWTNRGKEKETSTANGSQTEDESQIVPESFMDKSFQLRFRVPPQLLSNWKTFLEKLALQALPKHLPEEFHRIYQVFRLTRVKDSKAPTPRELKLYINQIGTIHRQWQHEFPLDHIAYYTILCRRDVNIRKEILNGKIPDPAIQDILSPDIVANLAGLHFNVDATLGQQLLLADPIANALREGDAEKLKELEERHKVGFWAVLESVMTEKGAGAVTKEVANAARCLDSSRLFDNQTGTERNAILSALKRSAISVKPWIPFDSNVAEGFSAVCRLVPDLACSTQILKELQDTIANPAIKANVPLTEETIKGLVNICEEITKIGFSDALKPFTLVTNADEWVHICPHIQKQDEKWWRFFRPLAKINEITKVIEDIVVSGKFSDEAMSSIKITQQSLTNCDWTSLATIIQARISADQNPTSIETNFLLQGLSLLKKFGCAQAQISLQLLAANGHLMHRLHQTHSENDNVCTARLLTAFLEQRPNAEKPTVIGNSEAGYANLVGLLAADNPDFAKQIVNTLDADNKINMLFDIVDKKGAYDPLIVACLRLIADNNAPERLFTQDVVMARWSDLWDHLNKDDDDDRFDRLLSYLCLNTQLVFDYRDAWLYFHICKVCSSATFREWCQSGLEGLDAAVWKEQLHSNKNNGLDLLLFLIDAGMRIALKQPFQDALVNHAKSILTVSAKQANDFADQWPKLLDALGSTASRELLRRRLLSEAMIQGGKCTDAFFQIYGDELLEDAASFYEEKDIVANLFSPLLRERNISGLIWLNSIFVKIPNLLEKSADKVATDDFLERLQGELVKPSDEGDQVHTLIVDIAKTLGISIDVVKEEAPKGETIPPET
jgi:hypothetical protein